MSREHLIGLKLFSVLMQKRDWTTNSIVLYLFYFISFSSFRECVQTIETVIVEVNHGRGGLYLFIEIFFSSE